MRIIIDNQDYKLFEFDSESELKNQGDVLILPLDIESPRKFYKIEIGNTVLGFLNGGHGIKPQVKRISNVLYSVSTDMDIFLVNIELEDIINKRLESIIYEVYPYSEVIIIICELDIYCVNYQELSIQWHIPIDDIITDYRINGDNIYVMTDVTEYSIDLVTGNLGLC